MDLSAVITAFTTSAAYSVARTPRATYGTDGRAVPGSTTTLTVAGVAVPFGAKDLRNVPEGMTTSQMRYLFTSAVLYTSDPSSNHEPDVVTLEGDAYQVTGTFPYGLLGNFYQYTLQRVRS